MRWRWLLLLGLSISPGLLWGATVNTLQYTQPTCGGSCTGNLDYCEWEYCTGTSPCTPSVIVPQSRTPSDTGNGGVSVPLSNLNIPMQSGETTACFRAYCVDKKKNVSDRSTRICCVGGTCS